MLMSNRVYRYFYLFVLMSVVLIALSCDRDTPCPFDDPSYWDVLDTKGDLWTISYTDVSNNELFFTDYFSETIKTFDLANRRSVKITMPPPGNEKYAFIYPRYLLIQDVLIISSGEEVLAVTNNGTVLDSYDLLSDSHWGAWVTDLKWDEVSDRIIAVLWFDTGDISVYEIDFNADREVKLEVSQIGHCSQTDLAERLNACQASWLENYKNSYAGWLGRSYLEDSHIYELFVIGQNDKLSIGMMEVGIDSESVMICENIDAFGWTSKVEHEGTIFTPTETDLLTYFLTCQRELQPYTQFVTTYNSDIIIPYYENHKQYFALFHRNQDGRWEKSKDACLEKMNTRNVRDAIFDIVE